MMADTISKEVKITDAVTFLPLDHNAKEWKEYILELGSVGRTEVQNAIIKDLFQCAGYDILSSGIQLLEYYKK